MCDVVIKQLCCPLRELTAALHKKGVPVYLITGGFQSIVESVAGLLNIRRENIFANKLTFYHNGQYGKLGAQNSEFGSFQLRISSTAYVMLHRTWSTLKTELKKITVPPRSNIIFHPLIQPTDCTKSYKDVVFPEPWITSLRCSECGHWGSSFASVIENVRHFRSFCTNNVRKSLIARRMMNCWFWNFACMSGTILPTVCQIFGGDPVTQLNIKKIKTIFLTL